MAAKKNGAKRASKASTKPKKGAAKRTVQRKPVDLRSASAATQQRVFRALSAALRAAGVVNRLGRIEVEGPVEPAWATFGVAARGGACPNGFILRLVCERRDGTVVCEERCVPE